MIGPEPTGIVAVFPSRVEAEAALEWLHIDGLERRDVSVIGPSEASVDPPPEVDHGARHRREIAHHWARWGAMLGGTTGVGPAAIAIAASTVGLGPFALALSAGIALVAATAGVGALGSALIGVGLHELQARRYESALVAGKFLIVIHTDDPVALRIARSELAKLGAESIDVHGLPSQT